MNAVFVESNQLLNFNNTINQLNEQKSENIMFDKGLFLQEVDHYLEKYPNTQHIDIYLYDLNGHLRGKRIDVKCLTQLVKACYLPISIYAMSLNGNVIEETGLGKFIGEPDHLCQPILGSLQPCAIEPETNAQLLLTMKDDRHQECLIEPRNILKRILQQLHEKNYHPCIAAEIEFYLQPLNGEQEVQELITQCFDIHLSDTHQQILDEIEAIAKLQNIIITGIISEASLGQYELNLQHTCDLLKLCDQIMLLKRTIKQIAHKHGFRANFLAKPDLLKAGSGMHFHMSLLDHDQNNIFSPRKDELSQDLLKVISGLLWLMPSSMAILAPNLNSFRRFKTGHHVPLEASWGLNNRNVAIRIPCSDQENQRLEYRVAGADCNPYLSIAMILIGTLYGLTHQLEVPKQINQLTFKSKHYLLPIEQIEALKLFKNNKILTEYLGKEFMELWCTVKQAEHQSVHSQITSIEKSWDI